MFLYVSFELSTLDILHINAFFSFLFRAVAPVSYILWLNPFVPVHHFYLERPVHGSGVSKGMDDVDKSCIDDK